ncbi:MAG: tRNA uridine-5-carboxymethylaminomethyl(34) synthesis GTPase MnmE [Clostridia bacterium]|nr:tRNA uridine-5-carboxymethylaminomethyl(34) synthesis GTPase MnmE [Clostridia bacterium]
MEKTICAISTSFGNSAISIIRMSGEKSLEIAKKYFTSKNLDFKSIKPRYIYLGDFSFNDFTERCLMIYFKSPNSYTGEDIVEFQVHGSEFLAKKILEELIKNCELASPGEFTKRAFLNGKLSLNEAEGVIDLINAESDAELISSYSLSTGRFNKKITGFQDKLTELLARMEVALDYPEHDEELITIKESGKVLKEINTEIKGLIENSESGAKIKSGVNVAIIGSPNVGKSSLLNTLLEKDRAIVSSIAGTTRDTLSETITYNGIKFNLTDTAGIRENSDEIEKIGIERAKKEIKNADIVLFVIDLERDMSKEENELLKLLDNNKTILILNKTDSKKANLKFSDREVVEISALKGINIDKVKKSIYDKAFKNKVDLSKIVLTNIRHINLLKDCNKRIEQILKSTDEIPFDALAFEIKNVWNLLGKITGETENEEIINEIFSRFCLGK